MPSQTRFAKASPTNDANNRNALRPDKSSHHRIDHSCSEDLKEK